ncbi:MAG: DegT/DnrJ/EryC1/StrS family aminotransferase, partial [Armatimonadetes bacterium]|nr:DegT/DnrJ/EryC1/StrS family aminotransferase [Armatimonadota bacterium]
MSKLAVNGGPAAARDLKIPAWPQITTEDKIAVLEALEARQWCLGPKLHEFMQAMAKYHDARHCIATTNGTTALQLALRAAGVRCGDEVIVPAVTFISTASAVAELGAIPVFADSDPLTMQICPKHTASLLTPRTTAVLGVHYGGYPFDLDAMRKLCTGHKLKLIEDCAHAQGTEWKGRKVGALGDASGMSLQASKAFAVGEGGVMMTDSEEIYEKGWLIHNIGRTAIQTGLGHHVLSSNYRMHEMQAALGLSALKRLPKEVALRHKNG